MLCLLLRRSRRNYFPSLHSIPASFLYLQLVMGSFLLGSESFSFNGELRIVNEAVFPPALRNTLYLLFPSPRA